MSRTYETAIKIGASISKAFKADTLSAASALTKLTAATKQLKAAEKSAAAFKKLDGELTRSKSRYNTATEALRKLSEAEKAAGGATKESTRWRKAGEREVNKAARQLDRATKAATKNGEALRALGVDTSKMASEQDRLTRSLAATERQEKALSRYEAARERLFGARKEKGPLFARAGEQARGIARDVAVLGVAATGAGAAMVGLALKTLRTGDEIGDTADKLGISSTALQELRYGAKQMGGEAESLDKALRKMNVSVGQAKLFYGPKGGGGGGPAIKGLQMLGMPSGGGSSSPSSGPVAALKAIHLTAKQLEGLKTEDRLKMIAEGISRLKNETDQAAVSEQIFGRGAADILPFLQLGSAGIDKMSNQAHRYGGVLSKEAIDAADKADKAMKDAEMALEGLTDTLSTSLLPVVTTVFKQFSGWVAANKVQIKQWTESTTKWIVGRGIPALFKIGKEVKSVAAKVLHLVDAGARLVGGFGNLALVIAGLRIAPLAITLGKIAFNGAKAAGAIFKYAEATKAAKAAGTLTNTGAALGKAATASMVIGAATIGYAIGSAIDNYFGISDKIVSGVRSLTGAGAKESQAVESAAAANMAQLAARKAKQNLRVTQLEAQGFSPGVALYYAQHPGETPTLRTGGGGGVHVHSALHVHEGTRSAVGRGMDRAKHDALSAFDKRAAHHRRVAYAE